MQENVGEGETGGREEVRTEKREIRTPGKGGGKSYGLVQPQDPREFDNEIYIPQTDLQRSNMIEEEGKSIHTYWDAHN